ncbi:transketolase (plasmid) [Pseudalkalibacillus hwajinpoensis]|uniref:transketolase n=1 Tax=Guptibacillus hwajinpoensis TaxID=208199 RepID=UPI00325B47B2
MSLSGRESYRDELTKLASIDERILCLEADLGGSNHQFEANHPNRFFNMGIAEMASIDIAAGLSEGGHIPFFSTFASFASLRSAESMKLAMGYMEKNIKVVAPYGGVSGGWFGTTHHALEDIAIVRSFQKIKIACPHGEEDTRKVVREAANSNKPYYIRLSRNDSYESLDRALDHDCSHPLFHYKGESDLCLISIGEQGTVLCKEMESLYPDVSHIHLCYVDYESLQDHITEIGNAAERLLVVEEHRLSGGTASLLSILMPEKKVYSHDCGEDWPIYGGTHQETLEYLGFSSNVLREKIDSMKGKKLSI